MDNQYCADDAALKKGIPLVSDHIKLAAGSLILKASTDIKTD